MKYNKRAQVFLIGAALFVVLILSLIAFSNKVISSSVEYDFNQLSNNIKNEMVQVINHDINNGEDNLRNFINKTSLYLKSTYPDARFLFIFGEKANVTFLNFEDSNGDLIEIDSIALSPSISGVSETLNKSDIDYYTIKLNEVGYVANFYSDKQVYFAIEQIQKDEAYIGFA